jgi:hypothetical protein
MTSSRIESFNPEPETAEHLSPIAARMMLAAFPPHIQEAFERRAKAINYPVEAVLEMAVAPQLRFALNAGFLDGEALSFVDCKPRY